MRTYNGVSCTGHMNRNCKCGNEARYITEHGEFTCALCPLGDGVDSIRLSDVPALLRFARRLVNANDYLYDAEIREIIGGPRR